MLLVVRVNAVEHMNCAGRHTSDAEPWLFPTEGLVRPLGAVHSTRPTHIVAPAAAFLLHVVCACVCPNCAGRHTRNAEPGLLPTEGISRPVGAVHSTRTQQGPLPSCQRNQWQCTGNWVGPCQEPHCSGCWAGASGVNGQRLCHTSVDAQLHRWVCCGTSTANWYHFCKLAPVRQNRVWLKPGSVGGAAYANTDSCKCGTGKAA